MIKVNYKSLFKNKISAGFTLIELIVAISIFLIVSSTAYVGFSKFNQTQTLNTAYDNLKNNLNEAKSSAQSQTVVNCSPVQTLAGYRITFNTTATPKSYKMDEVCLNSSSAEVAPTPLPNKAVSLPSSMGLSATSPSVTFQVLTGKTTSAVNITITVGPYGGQSKTIIVYPQGIIQ